MKPEKILMMVREYGAIMTELAVERVTMNVDGMTEKRLKAEGKLKEIFTAIETAIKEA
jgi:hypothetical protein